MVLVWGTGVAGRLRGRNGEVAAGDASE
jgi:hypothetical protein